MIDTPRATAFAAGMIATVNPCGFVMLPAYLAFFVGADAGSADERPPVTRALLVGAVVSAGFLTVFAVIGALVSTTAVTVGQYSPWLTIAIGAALAAGGVAVLAGWQPKLALPRLDKGGRTRQVRSMYLFGVSFAIASLSCTIGPFTAIVATTFARMTVLDGILSFIAYGIGMSAILLIVTMAVALAREGFTSWLRSAMPVIERLSGAIMVLAGTYLVWYGIYEVRLVLRGEQNARRGPVGHITELSSTLSNWLQSFELIEVVLVLGIVVCVGVLVALLRSPSRAPSD